MYWSRVVTRLSGVCLSIWLTFSSTAFAQAKPPQDPHAGHQQPQQQPAHEHMQHGEAASAFETRSRESRCSTPPRHRHA